MAAKGSIMPIMVQMREKPLTQRGRDVPCIRQVSVFVENRVGVLAGLMGIFDNTGVKTLALTVVQGFDCAIVRFVFDDTDRAIQTLRHHDYHFSICELVAVEIGSDAPGDGLARISKALLGAEIDIHYVYALLTTARRAPAVVIHVDNPVLAGTVLVESRFTLLDENDLR